MSLKCDPRATGLRLSPSAELVPSPRFSNMVYTPMQTCFTRATASRHSHPSWPRLPHLCPFFLCLVISHPSLASSTRQLLHDASRQPKRPFSESLSVLLATRQRPLHSPLTLPSAYPRSPTRLSAITETMLELHQQSVQC